MLDSNSYSSSDESLPDVSQILSQEPPKPATPRLPKVQQSVRRPHSSTSNSIKKTRGLASAAGTPNAGPSTPRVHDNVPAPASNILDESEMPTPSVRKAQTVAQQSPQASSKTISSPLSSPLAPPPRRKNSQKAGSSARANVTISASQPAPTRRRPRSPALAPLSQPPASERPAKRARVESPPPSSQVIPIASRRTQSAIKPKPNRHPQFWHLDGSVVIQVRNTLFRLHRSRLAQKSPYFSNLFASGSTSENPLSVNGDNGVVDSCSVFKLDSVSPGDFAELLTALDDGIAFVRHPPTFPVLAAILRAAHTLEFAALEDYTTHRLREMWPPDLAQLARARMPYAAETVRLARRCAFPVVLKRAYYELLRTPFFGQGDADSDLDSDSDSDAHLGVHPTRLSASDMRRLTAAREKLLREWVATMRAPPAPSALPCPLEQIPEDALLPDRVPARGRCRAARAGANAHWAAEVAQGALFEEGMYDPLCGLDRLAELDFTGMGYCVGCVGARLELWAEKKEKWWNLLDKWLHLPPVVETRDANAKVEADIMVL